MLQLSGFLAFCVLRVCVVVIQVGKTGLGIYLFIALANTEERTFYES